MRIAVLGAGFCGLAIAWHLIKNGHHEVHIFDPLEIGMGTSGLAAGLLHPYAGLHAKRNWRADEGLEATLDLMKISSQAMKASVFKHTGLLRLAVTEAQSKDYALAANTYADVHWHTIEECQTIIQGISHYPGIQIEPAYVVDCQQYLQGLWLACKAKGVELKQKAIRQLKELNQFDRIIIAMGGSSLSLPELTHIPLRLTKGQTLELAWPQNQQPLSYPLSSQGYLLMHPLGNSCIAGATYEKNFSSIEPDVKTAQSEILSKIKPFYPMIDRLPLINCRAGIRASTPNHRPLILQISETCWVLSGMGSKGLLYHALFAKELANAILDQ